MDIIKPVIGLLLISFCQSSVAESNSLPWKNLNLELYGEAEYTYWGFSVYRARVFLPAINKSEVNVLNIKPKVLSLKYHRSFTKDDFIRSGAEILMENKRVKFESVKNCLGQLSNIYHPVDIGDSYHIIHTAEGRIQLWLNEEKLGEVCDEDSTRAYLSIWLSNEYSIKDSFQEKLLGKLAGTTFYQL